jgi:hypothetical protein
LDDGLFEFIDVFAGAFYKIAQVEDGIADDLSGTVIGDVAATVGLNEAGMFGSELKAVDQQVFCLAAFPEGEYMGVLTKEEIIGGYQLLVKGEIVVLFLDRYDFVEESLLV